MADLDSTQSFNYVLYRGLNKRDDENNLTYGQTPDAQNFEIVRETGLKKRLGTVIKFDQYDTSFSWAGMTNYRNKSNTPFYIGVNYPNIYQINRDNGFCNSIDNSLASSGTPFFIPCSNGQMVIVDGANKPRLIDNGVASTATWPPSYSVQNNTLLDETNVAGATNPTTLGTDIGYPSFGAFFENRVWLAGDSLAPFRIYVSKLFDYDNFGNNSGSTYDIAFFVDVQTESPITGLKVLSDKYLVVYCEREIVLITGKFPPGTAFPEPHFQFTTLNSQVGCLGPFLVTDKGDNDHYFLANNGNIYTLTSTENFADAKPRGLSSKIFPLLEDLDNEALKRGRMVNHRIKGEMHLWFPSENYYFSPNKRLILNYSDSEGVEPEWSIDNGFGEYFTLTDTFVDDETNELIVTTERSVLISDTGLTYDGQPIDMIYQISTLDFGDPDLRKEIVNITLNATNLGTTPTTVYLYHTWEDNKGSFIKITVPPTQSAVYDEALFDSAVYTSFAGKAFSKIDRQISNAIGKVFKAKIRHNEEANLFIHSIIFRYKILGK